MDKNIILKDDDNNNLYPATQVGNVVGLSDTVNNLSNSIASINNNISDIKTYLNYKTSAPTGTHSSTTITSNVFTALDNGFLVGLCNNRTDGAYCRFATSDGAVIASSIKYTDTSAGWNPATGIYIPVVKGQTYKVYWAYYNIYFLSQYGGDIS